MFGLKPQANLSTPAVKVSDFKAFARIRGRDAEDEVIKFLLISAEEYLTSCTNIVFQTRTYLYTQDHPPAQYIGWRVPPNFYSWLNSISLPVHPVQSIGQVSFTINGVQQPLDTNTYQVDLTQSTVRIAPVNGGYWPFSDFYKLSAVQIVFTAGYGGIDAAPHMARMAIMQIANYWYENRAPGQTQNIVGAVPIGLQNMINSLKTTGFA